MKDLSHSLRYHYGATTLLQYFYFLYNISNGQTQKPFYRYPYEYQRNRRTVVTLFFLTRVQKASRTIGLLKAT
jgi:hypothetical protein